MSQKLTIKDSWNEVTISEYHQILKVSSDSNLSQLERELGVISILSNTPVSELDSYPASSLQEMYRALEFLNTQPNYPIQVYYEIGGKTYFFQNHVNQLTAGQFIDLNHYVTGKSEQEVLDELQYILSTFLLPTKPLSFKQKVYNAIYKVVTKIPFIKKKLLAKNITLSTPLPEKYMETPVEDTAKNLYDNMSIAQALSITLFFYPLLGEFLKVTNTYLEETMMKELRLVLKTSKTNKRVHKILMEKIGSIQDGAILQRLMHLQEETEPSGITS